MGFACLYEFSRSMSIVLGFIWALIGFSKTSCGFA